MRGMKACSCLGQQHGLLALVEAGAVAMDSGLVGWEGSSLLALIYAGVRGEESRGGE